MPWSQDGSRARTNTAIHKQQRLRILARDHYRCQLRMPDRCIGTASNADHIVAVHLGGTSDDSNLQAACQPCHAKKSSMEGNAAMARKRDRLKLPTERHPGLLP